MWCEKVVVIFNYRSHDLYISHLISAKNLVTLTRATLDSLSIGRLQLVQHTRPDNTNIGVNGNHIESLLGTHASIISIGTYNEPMLEIFMNVCTRHLQKIAAFLPLA